MNHLTVVARMKAKPGKEKELRELLTGLLAPTRKEKGCVQYDLHEAEGRAGTFLFYENWTTHEAVAAHFKTPHITKLQSRTAELLDGPLDLTFWRKVE